MAGMGERRQGEHRCCKPAPQPVPTTKGGCLPKRLLWEIPREQERSQGAGRCRTSGPGGCLLQLQEPASERDRSLKRGKDRADQNEMERKQKRRMRSPCRRASQGWWEKK